MHDYGFALIIFAMLADSVDLVNAGRWVLCWLEGLHGLEGLGSEVAEVYQVALVALEFFFEAEVVAVAIATDASAIWGLVLTAVLAAHSSWELHLFLFQINCPLSSIVEPLRHLLIKIIIIL